jgi:hypothetical protein
MDMSEVEDELLKRREQQIEELRQQTADTLACWCLELYLRAKQGTHWGCIQLQVNGFGRFRFI